MPESSEDDSQLVLTTLASLSLIETRNIKRDFCLTLPLTPSPTLSELVAADDTARGEADELEWLIESLPERMASEQNHTTKPEIPDEEDPYYDEKMHTAQVYQQWWELPGLDMNEGHNRTRFRSAYYQVAFQPRPSGWEGMSEWEMIWSMYDWEQRFRQNAEDSRKLADYSIRNQALLKQLPDDIDEGFDFFFESEGRVEKANGQSDFCQGKLRAYDGVGREVKQQARIVAKLNSYKLQRKRLQDTNKFIYRESKRFHDGTSKGPNWMIFQQPNEQLGDVDAYKANAITHLRLTQLRTPHYSPDPPADAIASPPPPAAIQNRKFAKLRGPSPRAIPLDTQTKLCSLFLGRTITETLGAPGRPNARVRRRIETVPYAKPLILHSHSPIPTPSQKRSQRQLHHARTHKTKTELLLEKQRSSQSHHDAVSEMDKLHWVLDDEDKFRDYRYFDNWEDMGLSEWKEMESVVGVEGVKSVEDEGGRRFSMD